jgi:hypothetical protein
MKSFFEEGVHEEIKERLEKLSESTVANWGKMNAAQMMHHCQRPLNIVLNKNHYNLKPNWLIQLLFKKSMYNDKPWKKNLPTVKGFAIKEDKNFNDEKLQLVELLDELHSQKDQETWPDHPIFGRLSKEQWGKMQYKHLDHHLRQFGA